MFSFNKSQERQMIVFPPSSDVWKGKNRSQKRGNSGRTAANTQGKQIKKHGDKCFCRVSVTGQGVMVLNCGSE